MVQVANIAKSHGVHAPQFCPLTFFTVAAARQARTFASSEASPVRQPSGRGWYRELHWIDGAQRVAPDGGHGGTLYTRKPGALPHVDMDNAGPRSLPRFTGIGHIRRSEGRHRAVETAFPTASRRHDVAQSEVNAALAASLNGRCGS